MAEPYLPSKPWLLNLKDHRTHLWELLKSTEAKVTRHLPHPYLRDPGARLKMHGQNKAK